MKCFLAAVSLTCLIASPLAAQSAVGIAVGSSETLEDGLDFEFSESVLELFYQTELEPGTVFRIRGGRWKTDEDPNGDRPVTAGEGNVDYLDAVVEYRFWEVFGSTGLFAGPGVYRQEFNDFDESDVGIAVGVNGYFPISRRLGVLAEVGYHWVNFEEPLRFATITGGLRMSF